MCVLWCRQQVYSCYQLLLNTSFLIAIFCRTLLQNLRQLFTLGVLVTGEREDFIVCLPLAVPLHFLPSFLICFFLRTALPVSLSVFCAHFRIVCIVPVPVQVPVCVPSWLCRLCWLCPHFCVARGDPALRAPITAKVFLFLFANIYIYHLPITTTTTSTTTSEY